jgi:hypothetical protein
MIICCPRRVAKPEIYDPTKVTEALVMDAVEIGRALIGKTPSEKARPSIREFACKYGLLGIMTALPTTARFFDYEKVYFPRNAFIREEVMDTVVYLKHFYPFKMPDVRKKGADSVWNSREDDDVYMKALMLTYSADWTRSDGHELFQDYGERYEWMASVFRIGLSHLWLLTFTMTG